MVVATDAEELLVTWLRTRYPVAASPQSPAATLLAEALDSSETGVDVDDGTLFKIGDIIAVDREMMTVTNISSNTLTVTRGTNSTAASHADNSEVGVFRSRRFKLAQALQPQAVDNFPGKVTIGAYNIDSNDLLSAWVISNLTGGHGIADHDEGVTDNRYRFGTIYTRYASQWTKPFLVTETAVGTDAAVYFGDVNNNGTIKRIMASGVAGNRLYENAIDVGASGSLYSKKGAVDFSGSAAQNLFHYPRGVSGFNVYNPATNAITNGGNPPDIAFFTLWDEKIIGIALTGELYYSTAAAAPTVLTAYTLGGNPVRLDLALCPPRGLITFINRNGENTVYVIGAHNVWAFDADAPRLYEVPDFGSHHPHFGKAWAVWRGELYVGSGMDILAFNGEVIRPHVSLSRDDGLPYAEQGYVYSLRGGQNALYALVRGNTISGNSTTTVHEWSGFGWHCIFDATQDETAQSMVVSAASGGYDLVWGLTDNGLSYTMALPVSFTNPREAIDNSAASFGISWITPALNTFYLETGRFDANMKGYRKIANAVEMDVRTMPVNNSIVLKYRIDDDTAWTTMFHTDGAAPSGTTVTTTGHHNFELGHYDPSGHYIGIDFETIEFRLEYIDTVANTTTPAVTNIVFSFLKLMNPSLAWTASFDLLNNYHDASPQVLLDELTEIRTLPRFFSIQHKARTYRAKMTGMQDVELGGQEEAATAQCNFLEIPDVLGVKAA